MTRRRALLCASTLVVALVAVAWLTGFIGSHPVYGPAKPVSASDHFRIRSGPEKEPPAVKFPQLQPQVVNAVASADSDPTAAPKPISLSGRVLDKRTGASIPDATVRLIFRQADASPERSVQTDTEGRYQFNDIADFGEILLLASAAGYCETLADLDTLRPGSSPAADIKLDPSTGRIAGRVLSQSRVPIPGALVEVLSGPEDIGQAALTDAAGAFSLALPIDGEYILKASCQGYGQERFKGIAPGMEQLELILLQEAAIAGRVTDEKGGPRQGLTVLAMIEADPNNTEGESVWTVTAKTDSQGSYRLDTLSASYSYSVRVTITPREELPPPTEPLTGLAAFVESELRMERKAEAFIHSKQPDAGFAEQTGVKVTPGQVTTVDFRVNASEGSTALIYGRVTDPTTGGPVCPVYLTAFWDESLAGATWMAQTCTNLDGSYQLFLPTAQKGEKVWIHLGWGKSKPAAGVEVDPEVPKEANFTLTAPIVVPVRCVDENGAPMPGLLLRDVRSTITGADGRGELYGLSPYATHTISAYDRKPGPSVPQARTQVGRSAPFSGQPGETLPEVLIRCTTRFGAITGQVAVPPEALEFMTVDEGRYYFFGHLRAENGGTCVLDGYLDAENRFTFDHIGPGTYSLYAFLGINAATRRQWWANFDNIEITPDQTLDLGLIHLNVTEDAY